MNEAELVLSRILEKDRFSLYLDRDMRLDKGTAVLLSSVLKRRAKGEPLAYCLGKADFFGLEFHVTPDVLVPRQETEILVETALRYLSISPALSSELRIFELGTGSGCIAVTLAREFPSARIDAGDISLQALRVAEKNAQTHGVKVNFIQGDLFGRQQASDTYDLIISNPPYIPAHEIDSLEPEVRREPRIALDGGPEGLDFYRRIAREAPEFLRQEGLLILEMGYGQRKRIEHILQMAQGMEIVEVVRDYHGIERIMVAKRE